MIEEKWGSPYATYNIVDKRKFDDHLGKTKDQILLKEWIEILLLDRNVLIYFQNDEIRATLKNIENIPALNKVCLERDPNPENFFTVWEIEKNKFVTFHYLDVRKIIVKSEGLNELSTPEKQLEFRTYKAKMRNSKPS